MKWSLRLNVPELKWEIRDRHGRPWCWHETFELALECLCRGLRLEKQRTTEPS
jgi:hypothetical protein